MTTQTSERTKTFRAFLKDELARRCRQNPAYSLRAFSKSLGVSHPTLSQVMSGKRPITKKQIEKIASALCLSPQFLAKFKFRKDIGFFEQFTPLESMDFDIQSDWIHDAILELTQLKRFKPDVKWIATALERTTHEVSAAVERLQRANLLRIEKSGKWKDLSQNNTNNHYNNFTNSALKKYQHEVLKKSKVALEMIPRSERDHTSLMLKFSKKEIQEAKEMIQEFRTRFSVQAPRGEPDDQEIYILNVSLFPISNSKDFE